jgi:poly(ADP-ribose) glycohydrolase
MCCIDAEDYSRLPLAQYEEDNVLRELNKSLLGFRQRKSLQIPAECSTAASLRQDGEGDIGPSTRRLSPIGESFSSTSPEIEDISKKGNTMINYTNNQGICKFL